MLTVCKVANQTQKWNKIHYSRFAFEILFPLKNKKTHNHFTLVVLFLFVFIFAVIYLITHLHDFANNIPPTPLKNICMMTVGGKSLTRFNRIYQMKLPMFCIPSYNINHRRVWSRKTFMYKLYSMGPQWCSPLSQFWKVQVTISENKRPYTLFLDVFTVCLRCINCFRRKKGQTKESYNFFLTHLHLHNPHREQLGLWTAVCCVLSASLTVTATVITIAQEPTEKEKKKQWVKRNCTADSFSSLCTLKHSRAHLALR